MCVFVMSYKMVCAVKFFKFSSHSLLSFSILASKDGDEPPQPVSLSFCVGITLSLTGMWADMGSYSDFQIHSAATHEPILATRSLFYP